MDDRCDICWFEQVVSLEAKIAKSYRIISARSQTKEGITPACVLFFLGLGKGREQEEVVAESDRNIDAKPRVKQFMAIGCDLISGIPTFTV